MHHMMGWIKKKMQLLNKHTNSNNTLDNCISTYMPQLQHYLMVSGYDYAYLSVSLVIKDMKV